MRYLQKRIPDLKVIDHPPDDPTRVFFGAWVRLADEDGNEVGYRIVGPDESDPHQGWISIDSPLARALLKKTVDDEVLVELPAGRRRLVVLAVHYTPASR